MGKKELKKKEEDCKLYELQEQKWAITTLARLLQNDVDNKAKL